MLKTIIQNVDGGAEALLGKRSGQVAVLADEHARARQLPGEHQRLIAGARQIGAYALRIAHDDNAIVRLLPGITTAQDRWTLPHLHQHARDARGDRRLSTPADRKVPDADDRMPQPFSQVRPRAVPLAPATSERCVEGTNHLVFKAVVRGP